MLWGRVILGALLSDKVGLGPVRTSSKWWLHCICMSGPHPHLHHYHQQKQPYSQFAPASGMLTKDPGQLAGPLPNRFLSTAAGFDSP
ncbi:Na(+)-translocating NADH-quinone reductase subunit A [Dissostichus eleginoides]|uniref:Na(+)-translocating NADH-quinone reductase subunit A n=1 Tax=Dissostichus eleginoides TaxID=100907 RepID=A0AAD9C9K2_DISEL|nr:Na(+)-translocating NADH-quinone reductase subunit A [Dissostichus eleginoides]